MRESPPMHDAWSGVQLPIGSAVSRGGGSEGLGVSGIGPQTKWESLSRSQAAVLADRPSCTRPFPLACARKSQLHVLPLAPATTAACATIGAPIRGAPAL